MIKRTYKDAINALNSLQSNAATIEAARRAAGANNSRLIPEMLEWTRRIGYKPEDLDRLNVIHVTGTKGKGSTCAFATSILLQYRSPVQVPGAKITKIGLYTSPHLKSVRERLMINGKPISEALFTKYFFDVWDRLSASASDPEQFPEMGPGVKPAYFRFLTLLSFHAFSSEKVDTAVYEVGVGGEYDSTNIFVRPTACGISSLGIDHTAVLGDTLEKIAWNKAGIFKQGAACFTVEQPEAALRVIRERAAEKRVATPERVPGRLPVQGASGAAGLRAGRLRGAARGVCHWARAGVVARPVPDHPRQQKGRHHLVRGRRAHGGEHCERHGVVCAVRARVAPQGAAVQPADQERGEPAEKTARADGRGGQAVRQRHLLHERDVRGRQVQRRPCLDERGPGQGGLDGGAEADGLDLGRAEQGLAQTPVPRHRDEPELHPYAGGPAGRVCVRVSAPGGRLPGGSGGPKLNE
ncbi:hypothetical protein KL930_004536 [Ogataea haglerorum]|nr:hypothetical protein KL930_004536 [Ogataea haglerorum]KAG7776414.1 hypothetical protein KL922_003849 [Ogataea haglerorum]KAG7805632.1 hypothetical protein KL924_004723 [Ogataea haglerorum]